MPTLQELQENFLNAYLEWTNTFHLVQHIEQPDSLYIHILKPRNDAWIKYCIARDALLKGM